ncbi:unnamed protein product [Owenia fusiformis]|uniref:Uncharacterized protein n=1 Tax=Owenia fusiformis TaxID=6347 RepID=A0A8J1XGI4_OWEFU|nr:unnamed protein product [Owenia fusiformis]
MIRKMKMAKRNPTVTLICTLLGMMISQSHAVEIKRELYLGDAFQTPSCFMSSYCQARRAELPTSGDRCKCVCRSPYLTYHQGVDTCVIAIPECQSLQMGSGSSSPPVIYLPRTGNKIIPSSPLYSNSNGTVALSGMAECTIGTVSVLGESNTWDSITYGRGLLIVPIEGKLYLEWKGDIPSRDNLRGNLVKVEVSCMLEDVTQEMCITVKIDGTTGAAVTEPEDEIEPTEPPKPTTTTTVPPPVQTDPLMQQVMITLIAIAVIMVIIFSMAICGLCYCRYADKKEIEKRMMRYKEVQENWEYTSQRSYEIFNRRKSLDSLRSVKSGVLKTSGSVRSMRQKKKRVSFQDTLIVHNIDTSEDVEAEIQEDDEKHTADKYTQENYKRHSRYSMHYIKNIVQIGQTKVDDNSNSETSSVSSSQVDETVKSTKRVSKTKKTKSEDKDANVNQETEEPDKNDNEKNDKDDKDNNIAQVHDKKSSMKNKNKIPQIKDKGEVKDDKYKEKGHKYEVKEDNHEVKQDNVEVNEDSAGNEDNVSIEDNASNEDNAGKDNHGYDTDVIHSDSDDSDILETETIVHVPLGEIVKSYESSPTDDSQSERTLNTGAENSDNDEVDESIDTDEVVIGIEESEDEEKENDEVDEKFFRKEERRLSVKDMVAKYDDGDVVIKPSLYKKKKESRPKSVYW